TGGGWHGFIRGGEGVSFLGWCMKHLSGSELSKPRHRPERRAVGSDLLDPQGKKIPPTRARLAGQAQAGSVETRLMRDKGV
ncbi:MAG: hypothetical protein ACK56I_17045, partial [bacterium]